MLQKFVFRSIAVTVLTLPVLGSAGVARAQDTYGATAYSPSTDATGISWDHPSERAALNAAVAVCNKETRGANDCKPLTSNANNCGAIAVGEGGAGAGWDEDKAGAEAQALAACGELEGGNCKIKLSACNN